MKNRQNKALTCSSKDYFFRALFIYLYVAFNKGIQNQAGNYTYNPRGNIGSLAENQNQQSGQFEINTDIEQVEKTRVRFNPNLAGHLIAFENVSEK